MHKSRVALTLIGIALGAPAACRSRDRLADLAELHGSAERDHADEPEKWGNATVGEVFGRGDALRTAADSDALVRLASGGALKLGPESLVRFRGASSSSPRFLDLQSGEAEIESGPDGLTFDTQLGRARIEPRGRLRIRAAKDRTSFEVLIGQTVLEGDGGPAVVVGRGERITFDFGGAILERTTEALDPRPKDEPAATGERDAGEATTLGMTVTASVHGAGVTVQRAGKKWEPLPEGDGEIAPGTRLRVPKSATVSVARGKERVTVRGAAEVFVGAPGSPLLEAVDGEVALEGDDAAVQIQVPGGTITARPKARAAVSVRRGRPTHVKVDRGEVEVKGKKGATLLFTGQSTEIGRDGELEVEDIVAPTRPDFSIVAGESAVVHDPSTPTGVRIGFEKICPAEGEAELSGPSTGKKWMRSRGMGSAVVVAGAGKNRYRVRCLGEGESPEPRGEGTVSIAKDWGTADLPRRAPRNTIDADGRRYTILYQNLLPQLTVGWPSAPAGQSFFLHVQADQGEARTLPARTASVQFVSGKLGEGTYTFWFEASSDPAHSSPKTTLKIDFDNAAPRAHIQEPAAGTPISGAVTVAGVAIEGASVSVSGFDMPLDAQYRFRGQASPKPGEASLAIRIAHPTHGVHYYLRRMQRGEP